MSNLNQLLNELATNPAAMEAFMNNPEEVMSDFGLNDAEKAAVQCGKNAGISDAVRASVAKTYGIFHPVEGIFLKPPPHCGPDETYGIFKYSVETPKKKKKK